MNFYLAISISIIYNSFCRLEVADGVSKTPNINKILRLKRRSAANILNNGDCDVTVFELRLPNLLNWGE